MSAPTDFKSAERAHVAAAMKLTDAALDNLTDRSLRLEADMAIDATLRSARNFADVVDEIRDRLPEDHDTDLCDVSVAIGRIRCELIRLRRIVKENA
jgi:hypothetical protein